MTVQNTTTGGVGSAPPAGYPSLDDIDGIMVRMMPSETSILTRWFADRYLVTIQKGGLTREWQMRVSPDVASRDVLTSANAFSATTSAFLRSSLSIPGRGGKAG